MTAADPADQLRAQLYAATERAYRQIGPPELQTERVVAAAIVDAVMSVFEQVTVQRRNTARGDNGRMVSEHRLVAMTPYETRQDQP